jgi:hypothetical protein
MCFSFVARLTRRGAEGKLSALKTNVNRRYDKKTGYGILRVYHADATGRRSARVAVCYIAVV